MWCPPRRPVRRPVRRPAPARFGARFGTPFRALWALMRPPCRPRIALSLAPLCLAALIAPPARGCDVALVLALDVSGSVDAFEYRLQTEGLAQALRDPEVAGAILRARPALAVTQWSGTAQQALSIPWTRIDEPAQLDRLATRIAALPRTFAGGNTAVGAAIDHAAALFGDPVRACARWVIDLSGDGDENEGFTVGRARRDALRRGITLNGLAIEGVATGQSITNFYRRWVVTPGGFVITARGHSDFARAMTAKLLRELAPPLAERLPALLWRASLSAAQTPHRPALPAFPSPRPTRSDRTPAAPEDGFSSPRKPLL